MAAGETQEPTDEELQARYEEAQETLAEVRFGYITVPDEAAAAARGRPAHRRPGRLRGRRRAVPGPYTLPELTERALPTAGAAGRAGGRGPPNTAFTPAVPEVRGVVVTFVEGIVYPSFEELRPQLEQEATEAAEAAGKALVETCATISACVNPRYGVLEDGRLVPGDGGVVDILGDEGAAAAAPSGAGAPGGAGD